MGSHVREIRYSEYPIQTELAASHFTVRFAPGRVLEQHLARRYPAPRRGETWAGQRCAGINAGPASRQMRLNIRTHTLCRRHITERTRAAGGIGATPGAKT